MAPELPGSHSSGPAEKEKTAKGGEGRGGRLRSPRAPRQSRAVSPRLPALWSRELRAPLGARGPPPATLIGEDSGSALKGRDRALRQVCLDRPGPRHQRTISKDQPPPMADKHKYKVGEGPGVCVCSLPSMNWIPIVLGSVSFSLGSTVATVSPKLLESLLMEMPGGPADRHLGIPAI